MAEAEFLIFFEYFILENYYRYFKIHHKRHERFFAHFFNCELWGAHCGLKYVLVGTFEYFPSR